LSIRELKVGKHLNLYYRQIGIVLCSLVKAAAMGTDLTLTDCSRDGERLQDFTGSKRYLFFAYCVVFDISTGSSHLFPVQV